MVRAIDDHVLSDCRPVTDDDGGNPRASLLEHDHAPS
jgi:hypothetical protein